MLRAKTFSWIHLLGAAAVLVGAAGFAKLGTAAEPARAGERPTANVAKDAKDFSIEGNYVEACSCRAPCPCELVGPNMSCEGVGAYQIDKGAYGGEDISGVRFAYSLYIGKEVHIYLDAPDAAKKAAGEKFARAQLAGFGPCKGVHDAKVEITGKDGAYTAKVDGGKIMTLVTEPMLGGDKKTPVVHSNTMDALNPTMYQAAVVSCTYADGDKKITLEKGRNSYFNQKMKSSGKL
jgi:hypothetical protein